MFSFIIFFLQNTIKLLKFKCPEASFKLDRSFQILELLFLVVSETNEEVPTKLYDKKKQLQAHPVHVINKKKLKNIKYSIYYGY